VKISATIITYNEERNIARAIESLRCCDEIVVVDSGSSDRTVELAANLGAKIVESPWPGYAKQKNVAADRASHDWILSLDADEALSEGLEAEIWRIKKNGPKYDAYIMPRLAKYLGQWIYHSGWFPDKKVRLYHREKAQWTGDYVHESLEVKGTIGHLEGRILHYTCDSLSEHLRTLDRYTTLAAEQIVAQGKPVTLWHLAIDPAWTFIRTYVFHMGFMDGLEGLAIAYMAAFYNFLKYAKAKVMGFRGDR
jgi:glycosyltransferase involved in cell wall biosynthesis